MKILRDSEFDIDKLFEYLNNLDDDVFNICEIYKAIIISLLDNLENKDKFKFKIPSDDEELYIELKNKNNILKSIDYIIQHFYKYEIYEFIRDFVDIRKYYEDGE